MTADRIERALAEVTREARIEVIPTIDWEALEERLPMTRVQTIPPRPVSWRPLLLAAAFAATVVALGVGWVRSHPSTPEPVTASKGQAVDRAVGDAVELDGNSLALGTRVEAALVPRSVVHRGHVKWTLSPRSSATLLAAGDVVVIRLDVGSVTSRVVKSSRIETFAVEAADVRVAAHGTEFVVTLGADGVSVNVTEGTVLVGPREEPGQGELLPTPSSKHFTLAGKPRKAPDAWSGLNSLRAGRPAPDAAEATALAEQGGDPAEQRTAPTLGVPGTKSKTTALRSPQAASPEAVAEAEGEHAPEKASLAGLASTTGEVVKLSAACFKQRTATSDGVRVMAQTTVTFRTLPEGGMKSINFEPPLSPWVQACVNAGMGGIRTEATRYGFQVSRTVDLER